MNIMTNYWHLLLLVNCFIQLHSLPAANQEKQFHHPLRTNHSDVQSAESTESGSLELAEKPYVPFDPIVVEGNVQSARKPVHSQRETSTATFSLQTQTNLKQEDVVVTSSTKRSEPSNSGSFSQRLNTTQADKHSASAESSHQPEEINYLDRAEPEIAANSKSSSIEVSSTTGAQEISHEYSGEDYSSPSTPQIKVGSSPTETTTHKLLDSTAKSTTLSILFAIPTTENTFTLNKISPVYTTSSHVSTENYISTSSTSSIPLTTLATTENNQQGSPSMLVTNIAKVNVRFTVSAEDTRKRTKVDSVEVESSKSASSEELVPDNSNRAFTQQSGTNDNMLTQRQSKSIDTSPTKEQSKLNDEISSRPPLRIVTKRIDTVQTLSTEKLLPSTSPMAELESLEALFSSVHPPSMNKYPVTVTSLITSTQTERDPVINIAGSTTPSDVSSTHKQNDKTVVEPAILNITLPPMPEEEFETTTAAAIERATIRRRILRPLLKSKPTKFKKSNQTTSETTEFSHTEVAPTTSTPLKTLDETIAPPVMKSTEDEADYPIDMIEKINSFENDVSEAPVISAKTTNTIIISSIVGGCALVFFAFLTVFCKCKQKYSRRTLHYNH